MRKVIVNPIHLGLKPPEVQGLFHQFGVAYEEFESGPGMFTTAIVELTDGSVVSVPADSIRFVGKEEVVI